MKRLAVLASAALALPMPAQAHNVFVAFLSGYQEVPPVSTEADGVFQVQVNRDRTSFDYVLQYKELQGTVTQAHIHFAQKAVNGPIIIWLCGSTTNPGPTGTQTCPQSGTVRGTVRAADVLAAPATQQLAAGEIAEVIRAFHAGAAYVNVHTSISGGGEIRGQIRPW